MSVKEFTASPHRTDAYRIYEARPFGNIMFEADFAALDDILLKIFYAAGLTTGDIIYGLGFGALMAAIGYWLLRKSKRDELVEVWAEKWPAQPAECEAPAEPEELPQV